MLFLCTIQYSVVEQGVGFFQCCLNLCAEFTWSVLSIFKYYANYLLHSLSLSFFKFILLSWIAHSSVLIWKLSPKTPWYFGNSVNFVSSWHLPELGPGAGPMIPMGPLNSVYSMILWETCFIYKLLLPSFLPEPDVQQLLGFFNCLGFFLLALTVPNSKYYVLGTQFPSLLLMH